MAHTPTKEEVLRAIDETMIPHLVNARKQLGISSPNRFYDLLKSYDIPLAKQNNHGANPPANGADFLE